MATSEHKPTIGDMSPIALSAASKRTIKIAQQLVLAETIADIKYIYKIEAISLARCARLLPILHAIDCINRHVAVYSPESLKFYHIIKVFMEHGFRTRSLEILFNLHALLGIEPIDVTLDVIDIIDDSLDISMRSIGAFCCGPIAARIVEKLDVDSLCALKMFTRAVEYDNTNMILLMLNKGYCGEIEIHYLSKTPTMRRTIDIFISEDIYTENTILLSVCSDAPNKQVAEYINHALFKNVTAALGAIKCVALASGVLTMRRYMMFARIIREDERLMALYAKIIVSANKSRDDHLLRQQMLFGMPKLVS